MSAAQPFVPETTPTINRANRLMSVRSNAGFLDIIRISQDLVKTAADVLIDFPGWDSQQITVLKARAQAAKEHHDLLFAKINEAIRQGIEEASTSTFPEKTAEDALEQGDLVRQQVLQKFDEMESRPAGSYEVATETQLRFS